MSPIAICVGCGLIVEDGLLKVHLDPAGGIDCSEANGLSAAAAVAGAQASADAAMAAANEADDTADAAQGTANAAVASAAYRARLFGADVSQSSNPSRLAAPPENTPLLIQGGSYTGTVDVDGDVVIGFNPFPNGLLSITANPGALDQPYLLAFHDSGSSSAISVKVFELDGTWAPMGTNLRISYIAIGW